MRPEQPCGDPPAVSVIIPAYNAAGFIAEAIDSALAQTFEDREILVINDGSPDTEEMERVLEQYEHQIIYLKQKNRGPGGARNEGILRARGEYVALLDSDDVWLPEYLTEQMAMLRANPSLDLVYANTRYVGDTPLAGKTSMGIKPSLKPVTFEGLVAGDCTIVTSSVVARRRALIDAGLFDERFFYSEDFDLWLRLAHRGGRIDHHSQVLAVRRVRADSLSADPRKMLEGAMDVCFKLIETLELTERQRSLLARQAALLRARLRLVEGKDELVNWRYDRALQAFGEVYRIGPTRKLRLVLLGLRLAPGLVRRAYLIRHSRPQMHWSGLHTWIRRVFPVGSLRVADAEGDGP